MNRSPLLFLARPERFELPTNGFEGHCSIQLSYERVIEMCVDRNAAGKDVVDVCPLYPKNGKEIKRILHPL